jgi:hypothetical protein
MLAPARTRESSSVTASLQTLRAVEHIRRMRGGSQSHLMRCSDGNYYVVKFQNNPQHRRVLVNELLGTKLATLMGLPTTEVAIIEVTGGLIRLTPDLRIEIPWTAGSGTWFPCHAGLEFGSRYPGDPHYLTVLNFLPDRQLLGVRKLGDFFGMLVFDLWTCNTDPRQVIFGRQEAGIPYQAWMVDQGFCFHGGEWNFPDKPRGNLYDRKVVYEQVRGFETFEPWLDVLESQINEQSLLEIAKTIPPEWYEFDCQSLHRLLEQLDSRRSKIRELLWSARNSRPLDFPNWIDGLNQMNDPVVRTHCPDTHPGFLWVPRQQVNSKIGGTHMTSKKRNGMKNILRT